MRKYQILFSDLDGTLLRDDMTVSARDQDTITAMTAAGFHFVPCTGRTFTEIPEVVRCHPAIRYILSSNGAVLHDLKAGTRTLCALSRDTVGQMLDILECYNVLYDVRKDGCTYSDSTRHSDEDYAHHNVNTYNRDFLREHTLRRDDFSRFCRDIDDMEMVLAFFASAEEALACQRRLEATGLLQGALTDRYLLEIFHKDAGKGNAIRRLTAALGIDPAATIAVGDTGNDITAIRAAGLGLAMGNAVEELKTIADAVICSNADDPITYIYQHYLKEI